MLLNRTAVSAPYLSVPLLLDENVKQVVYNYFTTLFTAAATKWGP